MALPIPTSPLSAPSFTENRGNQLIDPINGSTKDLPVVYTTVNACDADDYKKFRATVNIVQKTADCKTVSAGQLSISGFIPFSGNAGDFTILLNQIKPDIESALGATP